MFEAKLDGLNYTLWKFKITTTLQSYVVGFKTRTQQHLHVSLFAYDIICTYRSLHLKLMCHVVMKQNKGRCVEREGEAERKIFSNYEEAMMASKTKHEIIA